MHFLRHSFQRQARIWSTAYSEHSWKRKQGQCVCQASKQFSTAPCELCRLSQHASAWCKASKYILKKKFKSWKETKEQRICPNTWKNTVPYDLLCIPGSNSWAAFRDRVARPRIPVITQWKWKQPHRCQRYDASFIVPGRMGVQYGFGAVCLELKSSCSST